MPYVAPSTVSTLQTYTSAAHNIIVNDVIDHESRINTVVNTQYPYRNVLVNGDMQIAQRGTSVSGISSGSAYNTADRWLFDVTTAGTHTQALSADAPTGSGFRNSLRVTCTTALTSLSATSYIAVQQRLEGQTLQHIKKGTSSAQQLTLSFWVKGNKTGASNTYIVELVDNDNTRQVSASYTISASDTWEQKTITFPADTTGVLDNDNALSMQVLFWLAAGTNYSSGTLNTTWAATTTANRVVGQTNLASANSNYWAVTGVQLEPGAVASPFEFVRYDDSLRRCQRYYCKSYDVNVVPGTNTEAGLWIVSGSCDGGGAQSVPIPFPVNMRSGPATVTFWTSTGTVGNGVYSRSGAGANIALTVGYNGTRSMRAYTASTGGVWVAQQLQFHWSADAEL